MLEITGKDIEGFDNETNEFVTIKSEGTFKFEHSLRSLSKWESKWKKPFLINEKKSEEEWIDYFSCMCIGKKPSKEFLSTLEVQQQLKDYIEDPMTATVITSYDDSPPSSAYTTSEVIYAMMAMAQVPFECDTWPLSRLLMVLQVIAEKSKPKKNIPKSVMLERNRKLNEERRKALHSKG